MAGDGGRSGRRRRISCWGKNNKKIRSHNVPNFGSFASCLTCFSALQPRPWEVLVLLLVILANFHLRALSVHITWTWKSPWSAMATTAQSSQLSHTQSIFVQGLSFPYQCFIITVRHKKLIYCAFTYLAYYDSYN